MKLHYFPLEVVKSRYTEQLCNEWMPYTFQRQNWSDILVYTGQSVDTDIQVGQVLDATGRGIFSLTQCAQFLEAVRRGDVHSGDVLYFQDYWTPGIDAIFYALKLYDIKVRAYAMCHAQSVDEYDFTHDMLPWIRHYELGIDKLLSGIFVASTIHKRQLERANFTAPIHVVGLPYNYKQVERQFENIQYFRNKEKTVIFTSRLDAEKNPAFMLKVAERFLNLFPEWTWKVTTSASTLRSNREGVVEAIESFASRQLRFKVLTGLSKDDYYQELATATIQFNCSLQDYISWTLLEALTFDCMVVYPNWRSFPECLPTTPRYGAFDAESALKQLERAITVGRFAGFYTHEPLERCLVGLHRLGEQIYYDYPGTINVWE